MRKFFSFLLLVIIFSFSPFCKIKAGTEHNVSGWAWSENIGWVSFNSTSDGSPINYGVHIDPNTGKFSGYAWSRGTETDVGGIGWISFNRTETGSPPSSDPCPDGSCIARVEDVSKIGSENVKILGWARACGIPAGGSSIECGGGGWDGWIKLGDTNGYWVDPGNSNDKQVYIDSDPDGDGYAEFHGWAWSNNPNVGPFGWLSFNSSDPGAGGSSYKVVLNLAGFNQLPTATELSQDVQYCNIYADQGKVSFSWRYIDPEGTNQAAYSLEVQQLIGGTWQTKVLCENVTTSAPSSGGIGTSAVYIKSNPTPDLCDLPVSIGDIEYGKSTRWRVNVKDGDGNWSGWTDWTSPFSIASHAYPWIDFSWNPEGPTVGETVNFTDQSECYDAAGNVVPCSSFHWEFEDGNPRTSSQQNATTTFSSPGSKNVTSTVTDSSGFSCSDSKTIQISFPLPKWKEIPPIIWIRKFLAATFELFKI